LLVAQVYSSEPLLTSRKSELTLSSSGMSDVSANAGDQLHIEGVRHGDRYPLSPKKSRRASLGTGVNIARGEHKVEQFAAVIDYQSASRCFAASGKSGKGLVILDSCTRQA
jgi:hypothetical protein